MKRDWTVKDISYDDAVKYAKKQAEELRAEVQKSEHGWGVKVVPPVNDRK
jgi:hypothetical protein